jgi:hypothetical protein
MRTTGNHITDWPLEGSSNGNSGYSQSRLPHGPIVRLVGLTVDQQVGGMAELLDRHAAELTGPVMITITRGRIWIRR